MFMLTLNVYSAGSVRLKFKRHTRVTITNCDYEATIYKNTGNLSRLQLQIRHNIHWQIV